MHLVEAIGILKRYRPELVLLLDHIYREPSVHDLNSRRFGESAVYTAFDALADTGGALTARLSFDTSRLKPRIR
jgi:hypothetical protein